MMISRSEFLEGLRGRISEQEKADIESGEIRMSSYNRTVIRRLLSGAACPEGMVDTDRADELQSALETYLERYMPEYPQGHKWIILSCLFLAMAAEEPLHPQQAAGWIRRGDACYCRAREDQPGSICKWCVCRSGPPEQTAAAEE